MTAADPPVRHPVPKARVELAGQSDLVVTGHKRDSFAPAIVILRQGDDDGWVLPPGKALSLPGGTFDRLVVRMLETRTSDLVVRRASPDDR